MDEYIEEKEKYIIDNKEYTVISRYKKEKNEKEIYDILCKYILQKIDSN